MNLLVFSALQITALLSEIRQQLIGLSYFICHSHKTTQFFLQFKKEKNVKTLFLSFQTPLICFYLTEQKIFPLANLLENSWQHYLSEAILVEIEQLNQDRILKFDFRKNQSQFSLICEFFTKHPNYYLLDEQGKILYSLYPVPKNFYQLPFLSPLQVQPSVVLKDSKQLEEIYKRAEQEWFFQREKLALEKVLRKGIKKLQKKRENLLKAERECLDWETIQHEGELLKSFFSQLKKGMSQLTLWDWLKNQEVCLKLDPELLPSEQLKYRFKKAKKLRISLPHLEKQLLYANQDLLTQVDQLNRLQKTTRIEELSSFKSKKLILRKAAEQLQKKQLPYREFLSSTNTPIWVGKNDKGNDRMTFALAKGSDWWLHTQDVPGSHIVIRTKKDQDPDEETLADAMQLALYNSKAKVRQEAEICMTQRKFLSRMGKNQLGKVQISKHRSVWIRFDLERYQAILKRQKLPNG
ncbi:NFACT RNA binding domain-containing protein [Candidatus Protochlamydia sp. W-9]|uniref:NFACT RNA binding domain-containing protein n=1 Tax=Candidatus Protochlamydia sp. W-9 TaxID=1785087 RepID=UPI00096A2537|nr:NFACT RNA binding domain-containing protein [Candidatus Protochlamydia sp. W-9]